MPVSQQSDLYISLFNNLSDGIIISDKEGKIVYVNDAAEDIRSIRREDVIGRNILQCHNVESLSKVSRAVEHLKNNPKLHYHRMVTDKKNEKVYENSYTSITNENGEFLGMAVISRDVTEKRSLEEKKVNEFRMQEEALHAIQLKYHKLILTSFETLTNLLEAKDPYTSGHSKRVTEIALKMYEHKNGMSSEYFDIEAAAKLHDIGKVCIPDAIIQKPGKLTEEEFAIVKQHSTIAADLIRPLDPQGSVTSIILSHHERYDGRGYPEGKKGEQIPAGARIITIADSYDAMSKDRPYRKALSYDACVKEMKENAGKQFDPEWTELFLDLLGTGSI